MAFRLGRIRILPPNIQRRAADLAVPQRGVNRVFIEYGAARDIDEDAEGFISATRRASIKPSVSGPSAMQSATKSHNGSMSSSWLKA